MAKLVKGSWRAAVMASQHDQSRPCVGLQFGVLARDLPRIHPLAMQAIVHHAAAELARTLAANFTEFPIFVDVSDSFYRDGDRMVGTFYIDWHHEIVDPKQDGSYVQEFMQVAAAFLAHLQSTEWHTQIVCVDTEAEAAKLVEDPEVDLVICTRPPPESVPKEEPDPEINAPPANGVN